MYYSSEEIMSVKIGILIYVYCIYGSSIQGGEDPWVALSCRLFFAKEPLIIGLFYRN